MTGKADVFVIGGGFSGTALTVGLLDRNPGLRVVLSQRADGPPFGMAYETDCPLHLLNVPAKSMSAFADKPSDFLDWANSNSYSVEPGEFVPRMVYRRYLESLRARSVEGGLELVDQETVGVRRFSGGWRCRLADGSEVDARCVVLAFGGFPRSSVPELSDVQDHPAFVANPWSSPPPFSGDADKCVGIIGSGLTAIDTVLTYEAAGFEGKYVMISRRGLLPRRHDFSFAPFPSDEVPAPDRSIRTVMREVLRASRRAEELGTNWRAVLDAMRPNIAKYWQALNVEDRGRFLRHVRPFWEVHRHRMAPVIADRIERLQAEGRLIVRAERLLGAEPIGERISVLFKGKPEPLVCDRVVNCTGPANRVMAMPSPLVHQLLTDGIGQADRYQLGLFADEHGRLLAADGSTQEDLYVLGLLRRGQLWESTAVPELRVQASVLSDVIAAEFAGRG